MPPEQTASPAGCGATRWCWWHQTPPPAPSLMCMWVVVSTGGSKEVTKMLPRLCTYVCCPLTRPTASVDMLATSTQRSDAHHHATTPTHTHTRDTPYSAPPRSCSPLRSQLIRSSSAAFRARLRASMPACIQPQELSPRLSLELSHMGYVMLLTGAPFGVAIKRPRHPHHRVSPHCVQARPLLSNAQAPPHWCGRRTLRTAPRERPSGCGGRRPR